MGKQTRLERGRRGKEKEDGRTLVLARTTYEVKIKRQAPQSDGGEEENIGVDLPLE